MTARTTALTALIACRRQNAWSDGILKEYIARDKLDRRDAALASRLCYGVLQNQLLLDFYIGYFLKGQIKDLQPVVLDILRLGVYQLTLMSKIPAAAAVNEAVNQGKKYANSRAAGLINGVLRAVSRAQTLPEPADIAVRYSHPKDLVELLRDNVGEEILPALLASHNSVPRTVVQVNTVKTDSNVIIEMLKEQGIGVENHPWLPNCVYLTNTGNLERQEAFCEGYYYVQDPAARLAALASGIKPGMCVLDCCAAPGGKSFAAAIEMKNQGTIYSCDIHSHKIALIERGAQRLGLSIIMPQLHDALDFEPSWNEGMDVVIADVPCSGLGVIRKKPDIRYKDISRLEGLPKVQQAILEQQASYVRPGGILLYSTCTILKRENEEVVNTFLQKHPEFSLEDIPLPKECNLSGPMVTFLPCMHDTDGFFMARMRKSK